MDAYHRRQFAGRNPVKSSVGIDKLSRIEKSLGSIIFPNRLEFAVKDGIGINLNERMEFLAMPSDSMLAFDSYDSNQTARCF